MPTTITITPTGTITTAAATVLTAADRAGSMPGYIRDPSAIYARSFELIRGEVKLERFPAPLQDVVIRLVHACGMPDIAGDLAWGGDPATAGRAALAGGASVLADARMVTTGISVGRLSAGSTVVATLDDERVPELAARLGSTRSAAAVELWRDRLDGAVVAIGNAPTALFQLLERLGTWPERPAVILAFPVGFVGAAESKEALIAAGLDVPYLTLRGRRGGSALAAAAVNALLAGPA